MHIEHHWQRTRRSRAGLGRRQRQVGDELESVARGDDDAMHGCKPHLIQLRSRGEQGRGLSGAPVEQVPGIGTIRTHRADDPECVIVRLAPDFNGRIELTLEHRKVASGGGIDGDPRAAHVLGGDGSHFIGARVSHPSTMSTFRGSRPVFDARGPVDPQDDGRVRPTELRRNQASPARLTCRGSVLRTSSASIDMISSKAVPFHFSRSPIRSPCFAWSLRA